MLHKPFPQCIADDIDEGLSNVGNPKELTPFLALEAYLSWNGIQGYTEDILSICNAFLVKERL
jgi:hypothetical protein